MLNGLDLFSGIGGISLALREWVRPIAYCEIDPYCRGLLLSRMESRELWKAPVWDDVTKLLGEELESRIDIIYGGFPCQDISVAGAGKGLAGERSGLFFEIIRLAKEIKPKFLFIENVPALTSRGGIEVVREFTEMGYVCRWCVISAASVGALHTRERFFLLAYAHDNGHSTSSTRGSLGENTSSWEFDKAKEHGTTKRTDSLSADVADTEREGLERHSQAGEQEVAQLRNESLVHGCNTYSQPSIETDPRTESEHDRRKTWGDDTGQCWPFGSREHWQEVVSGICRSSDGVPYQVDRIKSLGNAVVPIQAKEAFKILMGLKK